MELKDPWLKYKFPFFFKNLSQLLKSKHYKKIEKERVICHVEEVRHLLLCELRDVMPRCKYMYHYAHMHYAHDTCTSIKGEL